MKFHGIYIRKIDKESEVVDNRKHYEKLLGRLVEGKKEYYEILRFHPIVNNGKYVSIFDKEETKNEVTDVVLQANFTQVNDMIGYLEKEQERRLPFNTDDCFKNVRFQHPSVAVYKEDAGKLVLTFDECGDSLHAEVFDLNKVLTEDKKFQFFSFIDTFYYSNILYFNKINPSFRL